MVRRYVMIGWCNGIVINLPRCLEDAIGSAVPSFPNLNTSSCCWSVCSLISLWQYFVSTLGQWLDGHWWDWCRTAEFGASLAVPTRFQRLQIFRTFYLNPRFPNHALCFDQGLLIMEVLPRSVLIISSTIVAVMNQDSSSRNRYPDWSL
jgi:hypothetical protein